MGENATYTSWNLLSFAQYVDVVYIYLHAKVECCIVIRSGAREF